MLNWNNPYTSTRSALFARNVVASSHPLAAQAGLRMLLKGGNAVDAIIATAAALTIVEPVSNGLGSDAFALVWDGTQLHGLNSSGPAPAAWNLDYFTQRYQEHFPQRGWDTVTVPGAIAAWAALSKRFGKLPFADLLEPAIELAERGHAISIIVAQKWALQIDVMKDQPGFAQSFMPYGRAPLPGEHFVLQDAGASLRKIAETQGETFYRGELAQALLDHSHALGGGLARNDLENYQPEWVTPIAKNYGAYTLHEIPPNGQGIAALMALGMLDHLDLKRFAVDSPESQHLQIEAMKLAFADVYRWVADERYMQQVKTDDLLDDAYLAARAKLIDGQRATCFTHGIPHNFFKPGGTVYLTAADENGMMVSFIQSNYMGFGSGIVVPGTGIALQNRGHCFSLDAQHPNCVAGGKRPFHTIIPGFLTKHGKPQMSFGVMGGNMQPQGHVQVLARMLTYDQQPQAACDAPRWKVNAGMSIDCESTMAPGLVSALMNYGHQIESLSDPYMDFGSGQMIWKLSEQTEHGYVAASDARRDGQAVGF